MKKEYKEAFTEVIEIIKLMPEELSSKIPNQFKELLEDEKSVEYQPNIHEPLEDQKLKKETVIILSLIYRDFLCSSEERKRLQEKDANELRELEKVEKTIKSEMQVKFNPDDIFKRKVQNEVGEMQQETNSMIEVKEVSWYEKIFNIIKRIFNIK